MSTTTLEETRERLFAEVDELLAAEIPADKEAAELQSKSIDDKNDEIERLNKRIGQIAEQESRRAADAAARALLGNTGPAGTGGAVVASAPQVYGQGSGNSYFLDLARFQLNHDTRDSAIQRLNRHSQELDVDLPKRHAARTESEFHRREDPREANNLLKGIDRDATFESGPETHATPSRVDGFGGYFVPPLWLVDEYIPYLRNGRPFANSVRNLPLPAGTDSVNIPKLTLGTLTGMQADNGQVPSRDITDSFVNAPVRTVAGQADFPIQLLDQSPLNFDEIIIPDLLADYALQVDSQCWTGTGTGQQMKGVDNVSGVNAVTFTSGSPTVALAYPILGQALSQLVKNRKLADGIQFFMQGPRWYWIATSLDSQNRPYVVPSDQGPYNAYGLLDGTPVTQGPVGKIVSTPVQLDLNITQVDGTGTNQDRVYAIRTQDLFLFEGTMRTRTLSEVLSGTLQVRFQVFNYTAFLPDRFPAAISVISGTGLTAPSGY